MNYLGMLLIGLGGFIIAVNWLRQAVNLINRIRRIEKHSSIAPFFGPFFFAAGYMLYSSSFDLRVLLVFLIDPDTVLLLIGLPTLFYKLK